MIRITEDVFIQNIENLVLSNVSYKTISYEALDMMNLAQGWHPEVRSFALDLINIIEPQFEMTTQEILKEISNLRLLINN